MSRCLNMTQPYSEGQKKLYANAIVQGRGKTYLKHLQTGRFAYNITSRKIKKDHFLRNFERLIIRSNRCQTLPNTAYYPQAHVCHQQTLAGNKTKNIELSLEHFSLAPACSKSKSLFKIKNLFHFNINIQRSIAISINFPPDFTPPQPCS